MKKAIFVYNSMSGNRSIPRQIDYIVERFQSHDVLLQPYRLFNNCQDRLDEVLKQDRYEFVVVSGGDGTLNAVANVILKNRLDIPIGILPSGTCNDFARCINIPASLKGCIDIILEGKTINVDIGLINETQYFLSTCAGGIFVDVSFNTQSELKKNFGPLAYYLKALSEVTSIKPFSVKITTEKESIREDILVFVVLNGKHAAGFSNLAVEADLSDGMMDILLIKNCTHIDLATMFFKVISNDFLSNKHVTKLTARSCRIEGDISEPLSIDGEKGTTLPIDIRFINRALKVFAR